MIKKHNAYVGHRTWFVIYSVALIFGIVWAIIGESDMKIAFITLAFALFLRSGVLLEASTRALYEGHH